MNTMTPDDHDLGTRIGRVLDRSAARPMSIELSDVRRGARRRRARPRVVAGVACAALAVSAVVVLGQRDEPTSTADRPLVDIAASTVRAAGLLPVEQFGEPTSVWASRGGIPRGVALPQVDVWQSGEQRIVVRTFLEAAAPASMPSAAALPSVPPQQADDTRVVERIADDQWVLFLSSDRELGDNVIARGMTRTEADAAFASLILAEGVLAPTGFALVEHADAAASTDPIGWTTTVAYGPGGGETFVSVIEPTPGRESVELAGAWSPAAVRSVDGVEYAHVIQSGRTSLSWRDSSGVFIGVSSTSPLDADIVASVELIDRPALETIAETIGAQHSAKPALMTVELGGQVVTRRGNDDDVVLCIGSGSSEECARNPGTAEAGGPPVTAKISAIVDGQWVIAGMMGTPDGWTPDFSDDSFKLPDGRDAPIQELEQDGTHWFVVTIPDGVDTITVSPSNDLGGIVGPIARPLFAESIG